MVVNFEFLDDEPIENVVTCLNFNVDKVVYWGYSEEIQKQRENTVKFLKNYCNVQEVEFHSMPKDNLQEILQSMRKEIQFEQQKESEIFFDITGGEGLLLVAFGMLAKEYETPMHLYDIPNQRLIELDEGAQRSISRDVPKQQVELNLKRYVELWGGSICDTGYQTQMQDLDIDNDLKLLWLVASEYSEHWNSISSFMANHLKLDSKLFVDKKVGPIKNAFLSSCLKINSADVLNDFLDRLVELELITNYDSTHKRYRFQVKNETVAKYLYGAGHIFEWYVFYQVQKYCDDCGLEVYIDWDGIIHNTLENNVVNEIDVLSVTGYIPTFISCKSGRLSAFNTLHALYELDTVGKKFGGKYARKILMVTNEIYGSHAERAKEMGIEIHCYDEEIQ